MKRSVRMALVIAVVFVATVSSFGQTASSNLPPGWIDGSKSPNLIPDRAAYRLIFIRLMLPVSPTQTEIERQQARLQAIGLSDADIKTVQQIVATFAATYSTYKQTPGATSNQAWAIVQVAQSSLLSQLSSDGISKFSAFVALEKTHMCVKPEN